ncbi:Holliday junction branch migration protein RuvA [Actinomycetaceae bacterium L2_0104]
MIAMVRGTVLYMDGITVTVDVGGIGFAVHATPTTLSTLREGSEATLHTSMVVREDSLTLFGFADADEKATFEILQGVSGVGPRLALGILAVHTPDALRRAVSSQDEAALQRVSGIGKKGAQRLLLELGTKLGPEVGAGTAAPEAPAAAGSDVVDALVGLGWPERDAFAAYENAVAAQPEANVATLLRASLQILGARK